MEVKDIDNFELVFDDIAGPRGFPSVIDAIRLDLAMTRADFAHAVRFHPNTLTRWEKILAQVPVLYKQYWDDHPRSKYLDRYQMFILAYMALIRVDMPFDAIAPMLRRYALDFTRENLNQFCKEKFDV